MSLQIVSMYGMLFFIGMCFWTDKMAEGYGVAAETTTERALAFMKFAGLNGMFYVASQNAFIGRIGHQKTMSLACFGNIVSFAIIFLWQLKSSVILAGDDAFSVKIGMDENMTYFNLLQQFVLMAVSYMGWVSSGSELPSMPKILSTDHAYFISHVHDFWMWFFGILSFFATDMLLENYKVSTESASDGELAFMMELMKFMGMLLIGNGIRAEMVRQGGNTDCAYAANRIAVMYYCLSLGASIFQSASVKHDFGTTAEDWMAPRIFDFLRNFGMMYWAVSVMTKND